MTVKKRKYFWIQKQLLEIYPDFSSLPLTIIKNIRPGFIRLPGLSIWHRTTQQYQKIYNIYRPMKACL